MFFRYKHVSIWLLFLTLNSSAWASYQIRKIAVCACSGNAGNVFPHRRFRRKPLVSDPGMHHDTCVTHVPWCMSGSLTCGGGENVPGIPGACAPAILRIWQEAHVILLSIRPWTPYPPHTFLLSRPIGRHCIMCSHLGEVDVALVVVPLFVFHHFFPINGVARIQGRCVIQAENSLSIGKKVIMAIKRCASLSHNFPSPFERIRNWSLIGIHFQSTRIHLLLATWKQKILAC